jgi:hypothetical protein
LLISPSVSREPNRKAANINISLVHFFASGMGHLRK